MASFGIRELFHTEHEIYQRGLHVLVSRFLPIFQRHGADAALLFPFVLQIEVLHSRFLAPDLFAVDAASVASAFSGWAPAARVFYAGFCKQHLQAVTAQREACTLSPELAAECAALEAALREEGMRVCSLSDLMATPFQRLMRYPMLFEVIAKEAQGKPSHAAVSAALGALNALARHCDAEKTREENRLALVGAVRESELHKLIEPLRGEGAANEAGDDGGGFGGLSARGGRLCRLLLRAPCTVQVVQPEASAWLLSSPLLSSWWSGAQPAELLLLSDRVAFVARGLVLDEYTQNLEALRRLPRPQPSGDSLQPPPPLVLPIAGPDQRELHVSIGAAADGAAPRPGMPPPPSAAEVWEQISLVQRALRGSRVQPKRRSRRSGRHSGRPSEAEQRSHVTTAAPLTPTVEVPSPAADDTTAHPRGPLSPRSQLAGVAAEVALAAVAARPGLHSPPGPSPGKDPPPPLSPPPLSPSAAPPPPAVPPPPPPPPPVEVELVDMSGRSLSGRDGDAMSDEGEPQQPPPSPPPSDNPAPRKRSKSSGGGSDPRADHLRRLPLVQLSPQPPHVQSPAAESDAAPALRQQLEALRARLSQQQRSSELELRAMARDKDAQLEFIVCKLELLAETQLSSAQAEILHAGPEVLRRLAQCGAGEP